MACGATNLPGLATEHSGVGLEHLTVNGWLGQHEYKHNFGVISRGLTIRNTLSVFPAGYEPRLWIVSFGSDEKYSELSIETVSEILALYPRAKPRIYGVSDLPQQMVSYAGSFRRGFGYWQWKPFFVCDAIENARKGDMILYVDGRIGVPRETIHWLDKFIYNKFYNGSPDVVAWKMEHPEQAWTTADVMKRFDVDLDSRHATSGQFAATFFALRVNEKTVELARQWKTFILENPELCRDEPSSLPNHVEFRENRHDQSVFSLLLKSLSDRGLLIYELSNADISSENSLFAHAKPHPRQI